MQRVFISGLNFRIVESIAGEESNDNIGEAERIFISAKNSYKSAFAWVECAWVFIQQGKYTHAGIAYMLAAAISIAKQKTEDVKINYTEASHCFFLAKDRSRAKECLERVVDYPCGVKFSI